MSSLFPDAPISRRELRAQKAQESKLHSLFSPDKTASDATGAPPTILTVCTGNICRSPLAEVLLRKGLARVGVRVHSAGTQALTDYEMTEPAQAIAIERGADADEAAAHRARYLVEALLLESDLILTMTVEQRDHVVELVPRVMKRAFTVPEFARLSSALTDEDARAAANQGGDDAAARLRAVALAVNDQRTIAKNADANDDVIDPYRRSRAVYLQSADQMSAGLQHVQRVTVAALAPRG